MARYTGPRVRISRRVGVPIFGPSKYLERRNYGPGMPGPKSRRKHTDYGRSEEHTSELQSPNNLVCRLLLEKNERAVGRGCETGSRRTRARLAQVPRIS